MISESVRESEAMDMPPSVARATPAEYLEFESVPSVLNGYAALLRRKPGLAREAT